MKCPICKDDSFIETKSWEPNYMGYGWSVKECLKCGYKVRDRTIDGRFAGIDYVIAKSEVKKLDKNLVGIIKEELNILGVLSKGEVSYYAPGIARRVQGAGYLPVEPVQQIIKELFEEIEIKVGADLRWAGGWKDYQALKSRTYKKAGIEEG